MKLQRLCIQNFRGIKGESPEDNTISFETSDIVFLIGQNNVGKSSFLRAYEFFVSPKQTSSKTDFYDYKIENPILIEAHFLKETEDDKDVELAKNGRSQDPEWSRRWTDENSIIKIRKVWDGIGATGKKQTLNPENSEWQDGGFGGFDTLLAKYAPTPIAINAMETQETLEEKINKLMNDKFLKRARETFPDDYTAAKLALETLQNNITASDGVTSINTNINRRFKELFQNLTLEIKPKDSEKMNLLKAIEKSHSVNVRRDGVDRAESFSQNGHGIIRQALFNFLAFLEDTTESTNRKEYIILFEEPELFLHPKAVYKLRKMLYSLAKSSTYQVLCATHSSLMIDISKPHSSLVRVAKNSSEYTTTYQVGDEVFQTDENKQIVQMINRFNSFVCECFYTDKAVLVEGDTEAIILRDLLERFAPDEDIFVVNTGSKNNIPFFQEVLTHFQITYWVIHDSDTPDLGNGSAWTLNQKIWDKIETSRAISPSLANRRVMITNFEVAHNYTFDATKGKPLSAFIFAQELESLEGSEPCCVYLRDILDNSADLHDQEWISTHMPS
jgi:predicted ATP-dependent endonuclease of OLD family